MHGKTPIRVQCHKERVLRKVWVGTCGFSSYFYRAGTDHGVIWPCQATGSAHRRLRNSYTLTMAVPHMALLAMRGATPRSRPLGPSSASSSRSTCRQLGTTPCTGTATYRAGAVGQATGSTSQLLTFGWFCLAAKNTQDEMPAATDSHTCGFQHTNLWESPVVTPVVVTHQQHVRCTAFYKIHASRLSYRYVCLPQTEPIHNHSPQ